MEITNNTSQVVLPNGNVLFTTVRVPGNCSILYQEGSGLVTLRGLTNGQCRARFRLVFTGNVKIDTSETISAVTLLTFAICQNGETIPTSTMIASVGDTTSTMNISTEVLLDVPSCCCQTISVKNLTTDITTDVLNANLIVERVA